MFADGGANKKGQKIYKCKYCCDIENGHPGWTKKPPYSDRFITHLLKPGMCNFTIESVPGLMKYWNQYYQYFGSLPKLDLDRDILEPVLALKSENLRASDAKRNVDINYALKEDKQETTAISLKSMTP